MGFQAVREIPEGRRSTFSLDRLHRQYTLVFLVLTDSPYVDAGAVMLAPGIPLPGAFYVTDTSIDLQARATDISPAQPDPENAPLLWHVTVNYSTRPVDPSHQSSGGNPQQDRTESPLSRPARPRWYMQTDKRPLVREVGGALRAVGSSAGEAYSPVPETESRVLLLEVTRNEKLFDANRAAFFIDTVNESPFQGFGARKCRLMDWDGHEDFEKDVAFWAVRYLFAFRLGAEPADMPTGYGLWDVRLRDHGTYYLDGAGKKQWKKDDSGVPIADVNLDGLFGGLLPDGQEPKYRWFRRFETTDFSSLRIPAFN